MKKFLAAAAVAATIGLVAVPNAAQSAGNLAAAPATQLEIAITGGNGAVSQTEFQLETGVYYRLTVTSDGGAEVLFTADDLFLNSWLNQIVVAGAEIKLWGLGFRGVEVGEGGPNVVQITFVIVRPGEYPFYVIGEDDDEPEPAGMFIVQ